MINANCMFLGCDKIIEIDLSEFDASNVNDISSMFNSCTKLKSLDLSNLNPSQVENMNNMFTNCQSLNSLDLSSLDTPQIRGMSCMFSCCSSLISLNLSNFDTSQVIDMKSMFNQCTSLKSLDITSFYVSKVTDMCTMFSVCNSLDSLDLSSFSMLEVKGVYAMFNGFSNLKYINFKIANMTKAISNSQNLFLNTPNDLIVSCESENDFLIETGFCKIFIYCNNNNLKHQIEYISYIKSSESNNEYICDICGLNYYLNNQIINGENEESNKCLSCQDNFDMDENENCYKPNINGLLYNKTEYMQSIVSYIIYKFNIDEINSGKDKEIVDENNIVKLTSTVNQKKLNEVGDNITIELGICEDILKNKYNISSDDPLYILQIISEEEGMKIPKLEYEVYYPLYNNNTLTKLSRVRKSE